MSTITRAANGWEVIGIEPDVNVSRSEAFEAANVCRISRTRIMIKSCEAVAFLLLAFPAVAQSQSFEAISIKPARSGDPRDMRMRVLPTVISMRARCLCSCC